MGENIRKNPIFVSKSGQLIEKSDTHVDSTGLFRDGRKFKTNLESPSKIKKLERTNVLFSPLIKIFAKEIESRGELAEKVMYFLKAEQTYKFSPLLEIDEIRHDLSDLFENIDENPAFLKREKEIMDYFASLFTDQKEFEKYWEYLQTFK